MKKKIENGKFKTWEQITRQFKIDKNLNFKWTQLVHAIPNYWGKTLTENTTSSQSLNYLNHNLMKSNQINSVEKLTTKELYLILLQHETTTPTSQKYFESTVKELTFQWKDIYTFHVLSQQVLNLNFANIMLHFVPFAI